MPEYQYWARTEFGDTVSGRLSAASPDAASHLLTVRGLVVQRLEEVVAQAKPVEEPLTLAEEDFEALAENVATATDVKLPLTTSLRALAEESARPRLKRALMNVLASVEQGQPLEEAFARLPSAYPRRLGPLVAAGIRTGKLPHLLQRAIEHLRHTAELRRRVWLNLAYPLILTGFASLLIGFLLIVLIPSFKKIFDDFGTDLPGMTKAIVFLSDGVMGVFGSVVGMAAFLGLWRSLLFLAASVVGVWIVVKLIGIAVPSLDSRRLWHEIRGWLPLVGTVLRSASLSGMFRLLADLVDAGIPLPESLRIAAAVNYDAALAAGAERISADLEDGQAPLDAVVASEAFPRDIIPLFRWADRRQLFAESLRAAGDIYAARSRIQSGLMAVMLEPALIFGVGLTCGFVILALFMPLIRLLNDLS